MDIVSSLVQLISGAVGGNIGGLLVKRFSLGTIGNTSAGIIGGGIGGSALGALLGGSGAAGSLGSVVLNVAGGGVGGIAVMLIVALVKMMIGKPS
jgi:hypothetical protein